MAQSHSPIVTDTAAKPDLLRTLPLEILQETFLHLDLPFLLSCRLLNNYFRACIDSTPQYRQLQVLFRSAVQISGDIYGYSFLHGRNAEALTAKIGAFFWTRLAYHSPSNAGRLDIQIWLTTQSPCPLYDAEHRNLGSQRNSTDFVDNLDRAFAVRATVWLLAWAISPAYEADVRGSRVPSIDLDLSRLPDKEALCERLLNSKSAYGDLVFGARYVPLMAECLIATSARLRGVVRVPARAPGTSPDLGGIDAIEEYTKMRLDAAYEIDTMSD